MGGICNLFGKGATILVEDASPLSSDGSDLAELFDDIPAENVQRAPLLSDPQVPPDSCRRRSDIERHLMD